MIQKIENILTLSVKESSPTGLKKDVDLTKATNILFAIKQEFGQYIELEASLVDGKLTVKLPYDKAMLLTTSPSKVQLMWTDESGNKRATKPKAVPVEALLREAGYD